MEAIEVYQAYSEELSIHKVECKRAGKELAPPPLPILMTIFGRDVVETAEDYMAEVIGHIKSSELEETLLVLPLDVVTSLAEIMETLLTKKLNCEVVCRTFFFLVEIHFGPLTSAPHLKPLLNRVRILAESRLKELKDNVGFNLAALR
jgi:U3 small nucleolar RNA-associated protein 12